MKIGAVSVRGFRTVKDEISFSLDDMITLVGPNNAGKTNTLKAIQMFFTGYENFLEYDFENDMCKGAKSLRTNIQITISEIDSVVDADFHDIVVQIRKSLLITSGSSSEIVLYLTFSENSNPVYRVYPNVKRPKGGDGVAYSRLERKLFDYVLSKISIHYIPSEKSVGDLYEGLIVPYLLREMYNKINPHIVELEEALNNASGEINSVLSKSGLGALEVSFVLPTEAEDFFGNVEFNLRDVNTTSVFKKGMGIQSAALFGSFCWIAQQEKSDGKLSLWLLEEPESYLHPELATQCLNLLKELSSDAQVIVTTHSLGFVPQNPEKVRGVDLDAGWSKATQYRTYHEATKKIRNSLGVKFSDYYNFSAYNILVEGQTDRQYFNLVLESIRSSERAGDYPILLSSDVSVHDYGGVKGIEGFLRATFEFIKVERASIAVFDGDDAGDKARKDLQGFFGQKQISFAANSEFVVVRDRFAIEGLLPDAWIKEISVSHPSWLEGYAEDASGHILPFKVKDNHKDQYLNWFVEKISQTNLDDWFERWDPVLNVIERSLSSQGARLY